MKNYTDLLRRHDMNVVEHMMELYREGIDELMGAERYAKKAKKATGSEVKVM